MRLKTMVLLIGGFMLCTQLSAQRFKASLLAGFNLSQIDGDDLVGYNRIGFNAGGKVAAVLTDRWQLSMELLYSQKGSNRSTTDNFRSSFESIRLNFVEVPVMLSFQDWKFQVNAGFSYGRLIDYKIEDILEGDVTDEFILDTDVFALIFGITYYFRENIGLNVRWSTTLNDIQAVEGGNSVIDRTVGVRVIYVL